MTTTDRHGTLLGADTWAALAEEYLTGAHELIATLSDYSAQAWQDASLLADLLEHGHAVIYGGNVHRVDVQPEASIGAGTDGTPGVVLVYGVDALHPVVWEPVDDPEPYADLHELEQAWHAYRRFGGSPLKVSDCYHDHPVWSRLDNLRFRVWHDTGHVEEGEDFTPDGEINLFIIQAERLRRLSGGDRLVAALFSESVYQLAACVHLGGFPDVQHVRTPGPVARQLLADWGLS